MSVVQSKTHTPIVSELNGATLNALADYILDWRPKCDIPEVFLTVKAPYRRLSKGFSIVKKQEYPKSHLGDFIVYDVPLKQLWCQKEFLLKLRPR